MQYSWSWILTLSRTNGWKTQMNANLNLKWCLLYFEWFGVANTGPSAVCSLKNYFKMKHSAKFKTRTAHNYSFIFYTLIEVFPPKNGSHTITDKTTKIKSILFFTSPCCLFPFFSSARSCPCSCSFFPWKMHDSGKCLGQQQERWWELSISHLLRLLLLLLSLSRLPPRLSISSSSCWRRRSC